MVPHSILEMVFDFKGIVYFETGYTQCGGQNIIKRRTSDGFKIFLLFLRVLIYINKSLHLDKTEIFSIRRSMQINVPTGSM